MKELAEFIDLITNNPAVNIVIALTSIGLYNLVIWIFKGGWKEIQKTAETIETVQNLDEIIEEKVAEEVDRIFCNDVLMSKDAEGIDFNSLIKSQFFYDLEYYRDSQIDKMNLVDPGRTLVFQDFLKIKFNSVYEEYKTIFNEEIETSNDLYSVNMEILKRSIDRYESDAHRAGIPDQVIKKFAEFHNNKVESFRGSIKTVCFDPIYGNMASRQHAIFSILCSLMILTVIDATDALKVLNGSLTGIEYRGIKIGNCMLPQTRV